jgi:glycosyltransferase involved in cell wall biosynthesis
MPELKILIHDFAGHPFQVQLSRELANRSHRVVHAYAMDLPGPKGALQLSERDSRNLRIQGLPLARCFRKYSPVRRLISHRRYASDLWRLIATEEPHVVLSGNTPIDVQAYLVQHCHQAGIAFVHWVQDVYFRALEFLLERRLGRLAQIPILPFRQLEKSVARRSDAVVVIAPEFASLLSRWGVPDSRVTVIENWATLDDVAPAPKRNPWSDSNGLASAVTFLYSGTLGFKHRPDLIYELARSTRGRAKVVVLTDGFGRRYLESRPRLENLLVRGFEPYERLPQVLASADVLLATLAADAARFAIPSKVMTYLAAGRAVLLAAPLGNPAALAVQQSGGGIVVDPDDPAAWSRAAIALAGDAELRQTLGRRARQYAERTFRIGTIADRFEQVMVHACRKNSVVRSLARPDYAAAP